MSGMTTSRRAIAAGALSIPAIVGLERWLSSETVPAEFLEQPEDTIGGMPSGEWRYTLPWAMEVDSTGRGWLRPDYPASVDGPFGTRCMRIKRESSGYVVDLASVRGYTAGDAYEWRPMTHTGPRGFYIQPVIRFEGV